MVNNDNIQLNTDYKIDCDNNGMDLPLPDYPRPSLKRDSFLNLNGEWDFLVTKYPRNLFHEKYKNKILVPFPIESELSRVNYRLKKGEYIIYHRFFKFQDNFKKNLVLLNIGACDQECTVYVNEKYIGEHSGGYLPFTMDITSSLKENNEIIIVCKDNLDFKYPYGKQIRKNGGIWYTPSSGIWKTIWIESVNENHIKDIKIIPDLDLKEVNFIVKQDVEVIKKINVFYNNHLVKSIESCVNDFIIKFDEIKEWTPENPNLYNVVIETPTDKVETYFGFRKISINKYKNHPVLFLNNKPYFMHGLLDQGFYPDGLYTPKSYKVYEDEIKIVKEYGFNTLRKHIKVEPEIWYYLCDKLGIIVWQDFVNNSDYHFVSDTVLPTIGLKKKKFCLKKIKDINKDIFIKEGIGTVDLLFNHPSIVLWTIFNEGWGQFDTNIVYKKFKDYDKTRIVDSASGWFKENNDIESMHVYFREVKMPTSLPLPIVLSEFGGYSLKISNHLYNDVKSFGYRKYNDSLEYNQEFEKLYNRDVINNIPKGLCACIYTQLSDVEVETNGIMTYDRKVIKINKELAIKISDKIRKEYE